MAKCHGGTLTITSSYVWERNVGFGNRTEGPERSWPTRQGSIGWSAPWGSRCPDDLRVRRQDRRTGRPTLCRLRTWQDLTWDLSSEGIPAKPDCVLGPVSSSVPWLSRHYRYNARAIPVAMLESSLVLLRRHAQVDTQPLFETASIGSSQSDAIKRE